MHIVSFVLFATCAAAGVAGGRNPSRSGKLFSRDAAAEFEDLEHAARRPGWDRQEPITKQALENVKYFADKVARDTQTALSADAPFKADPTETEEYWQSRETPIDAETWPSFSEVLGHAVAGLQDRWASVAGAVQMRASDAVQIAKAQAEVQKREAYGPAKRVKMHRPRELVYDRYDDLVEDEEGLYERELVYDRYDDLVEDAEGNYERDLVYDRYDNLVEDQEGNYERDLVYDRYDNLIQDEESLFERNLAEVADDDLNFKAGEDNDDDSYDEAEEEAEAEGYFPAPAATQPDPAQPQPLVLKQGHGHSHGHGHLHR